MNPQNSAAKLLTKDEARRIAANIAKISRRLIQCESVKRDDFFPGQLIGGAPAHDGRHIALLDELAILRPAPLACAVAVILWGPDASSDKLRTAVRCTSCGSKGATLQRPGWAGNHIGFYPFPTGINDSIPSGLAR